jgi:hypothetical protein
MDLGLCQRRFVWIGPMVVCMDLGLCQRLRFGSGGLVQWCFVWILVYANGGSVDCSNGVLYGSWFMPTAEVWFGWIGPMVFCMDLGLCQLRFGELF